MKRLFLYFYMLLAAYNPNIFSQTLSSDGECYHFEADISAGLNNDGWQWDTGAAYFPIQYVGLKTNIGFAGEIKEISDWCDDNYERDMTIRSKSGRVSLLYQYSCFDYIGI